MRRVIFLSIVFLLMSVQLMAQEQSQKLRVTGKVVDDYNVGLPGVNVVEKGTANGAVTDIDGKYSLEVDRDAILVFSFIGFTAIEVAAGTEGPLDVVMSANTKSRVVWCCIDHPRPNRHCGEDRDVLKKQYGCKSFNRAKS